MGFLMMRCPVVGTEFNSGYRTNGGSLSDVPKGASLRVRCPHCREDHAFLIADARISDAPSAFSAASPPLHSE